jgi:hypothetical protein
MIREQLLELGIYFEEFTFGPHTRPEIFGNLKHLLNQRKIELLDIPELLEQLRNLEERRMDGGRIDIQPAGRMRDDLGVVVALCCSELSKYEGVIPAPQLGLLDRNRYFPNMIPSRCPYAVDCENFPRCMDEGSCLGFKKE